MNAPSVAARPFVLLLAGWTSTLLRLLDQRERGSRAITEDEIEALLQEGSDAAIIDQGEHDMVRNVFRLDDRQIGSLMVPRSEIIWLHLDLPLPPRHHSPDWARLSRPAPRLCRMSLTGASPLAPCGELPDLFDHQHAGGDHSREEPVARAQVDGAEDALRRRPVDDHYL